jgi:hypothetical protein
MKNDKFSEIFVANLFGKLNTVSRGELGDHKLIFVELQCGKRVLFWQPFIMGHILISMNFIP